MSRTQSLLLFLYLLVRTGNSCPIKAVLAIPKMLKMQIQKNVSMIIFVQLLSGILPKTGSLENDTGKLKGVDFARRR